MDEPQNLTQLAQACILEQANSDTPSRVLADYFQKVYEMGVQVGLRQSTESLDAMNSEHGA